MSREILEAVREIEREKGIETGTLVGALQDGLLAPHAGVVVEPQPRRG
jgi:hypothetical protein